MLKRIKSHHTFMFNYSRALLAALRRPIFLYLTALSGTMMALFSAVFYAIEANHNPRLGGFLDSFYFTVTTMTGVGYGDITPMTPYGKILSILMMLLGTAIFVAFTAVLATLLIELELSVEKNDEK